MNDVFDDTDEEYEVPGDPSAPWLPLFYLGVVFLSLSILSFLVSLSEYLKEE